MNNGKDAAEVTNGPERVRMPTQEFEGQKVIRKACDNFSTTS